MLLGFAQSSCVYSPSWEVPSTDAFTLCVPTAPGISASPSEDNLRYFNVMILGPQQSPYDGAHQDTLTVPLSCWSPVRLTLKNVQAGPSIVHLHMSAATTSAATPAGGCFKLELFLPEDYPMAAPKVRLTGLDLRCPSLSHATMTLCIDSVARQSEDCITLLLGRSAS